MALYKKKAKGQNVPWEPENGFHPITSQCEVFFKVRDGNWLNDLISLKRGGGGGGGKKPRILCS